MNHAVSNTYSTVVLIPVTNLYLDEINYAHLLVFQIALTDIIKNLSMITLTPKYLKSVIDFPEI